jgi:4-amino-4-deoxy-L-arabinose transferase-like glycosyltransferase
MALYAALPLFVVHGSMGLMEPLVTALAMCTLLLSIRLAERPALDTALLLGLATGAGLLTKESALFTVAMVPLGLLLFDWRGPALRRRLAAWGGYLLVAAVVCLGCWSILMLSPDWRTYVHARDQFHRPIGDVLSDPIKPLSKNGGDLLQALIGYVGPVLMVLAFVGLWIWGRRNWRLAALVGLWGALPFVGTLLLTVTAGYPRYWLPAIAPLCLPMAVGFVAMVTATRKRVASGWPRAAAGVAVVAVTVVIPAVLLVSVLAHPDSAKYPGPDDGQFVTSWASGSGWKAVADYLDGQTHGASFTIAYDRARPLWVYLDHWQRARQVPIGTPGAQNAQYLVKNFAVPPLSPAERAAFRLVRRFPRPRGGQPILLYAHH